MEEFPLPDPLSPIGGKAIGKIDLINVAWSWLSHTARTNAHRAGHRLEALRLLCMAMSYSGLQTKPEAEAEALTDFKTKHHFRQKS